MPSDFFQSTYDPERELLRRRWEAYLKRRGVSLNRISQIARTKAVKRQEVPDQ